MLQVTAFTQKILHSLLLLSLTLKFKADIAFLAARGWENIYLTLSNFLGGISSTQELGYWAAKEEMTDVCHSPFYWLLGINTLLQLMLTLVKNYAVLKDSRQTLLVAFSVFSPFCY